MNIHKGKGKVICLRNLILGIILKLSSVSSLNMSRLVPVILISGFLVYCFIWAVTQETLS